MKHSAGAPHTSCTFCYHHKYGIPDDASTTGIYSGDLSYLLVSERVGLCRLLGLTLQKVGYLAISDGDTENSWSARQ